MWRPASPSRSYCCGGRMHVYRPSVIIAVVDTVNAQPKINVLVTLGTTAPGATGVDVRTAERGEYLAERLPA